MTRYCCVLNYCRKVSPLEGSKNRDSLLKKLVCVCVEGGRGVGGCGSMWMCIHVCMCVGRWVLSPVKKLVSVCVEGWGGLNVHAFGYV